MNHKSNSNSESKVNRTMIVAVLVVAMAGMLLMPSTSVDAAVGVSWTTEAVSTLGYGIYTSIDVGSDGSVHMSYIAYSVRDLIYSSRAANSTTWVQETVDSSSSFYFQTCIALDDANGVHISYYDETNGDLKYAYKAANSSVWVTETVQSAGSVGRYSSIAVSSDNVIHIGYFDFSNTAAMYAFRCMNETVWTIEVVDNTGSDGYFTSIALGPEGGVHMCYIDLWADIVKYAFRSAVDSNWTKEVVDVEDGITYEYSSIAVDRFGNIGISYQDKTWGDLKFAGRTGNASEWTIVVVDNVNSVGMYSAITTDEDGTMYIAYLDATAHRLKCAHRILGGSQWFTEVVDSTANTGSYNDIAVYSNTTVHISSFDNMNYRPLHAQGMTYSFYWAPAIESTPSSGPFYETSFYRYMVVTNESCHISIDTDAGFLSTEGYDVVGTLQTGTYFVNVTAISADGLMSSYQNYTLTVLADTISPTLTVQETSLNGSYIDVSSLTLHISAEDNECGLLNISVCLDGVWSEYPANTTTVNISDLVDGPHSFLVRAYDIVGNYNETGFTVTVDTIAPTLSITSPDDGSYNSTANVTVVWEADDEIGMADIQVSLDGGEWRSVGTDATSTYYDGLTEGEHTVRIVVTDHVDLIAEANVTFTVDTTAPSMVITSPEDGSYNNTGSVTVTWGSEDAISGTGSYLVSMDGLMSAFLTNSTSYTFDDLGEGEFTVRVSVMDNAGNSNETTVTFTIDTTAPSLVITSPEDGSYNSTGRVTVIWESEDANSGIKTYSVSVLGVISTLITNDTSYTFNHLGDGEHTIIITVLDNAGNSNETTVTFTIDTTAPSLVITSPEDGSYNNTGLITVLWSSEDPTSGVAYYEVSPDGENWNMSENARAEFDLSDGEYTIYIRAYDALGNFNETNVTFIVDTVSPTATTSPTGDGIALDSTVSVQFSEVMDMGNTTITIDGVDGALTWDGNLATFTPTALAYNEVYAVTVSGMDLSGNPIELSWNFSTVEVGYLDGYILDENGDPLAGVEVTLGNDMTTTTDESGHFSFDDVPVGDYTLVANLDGHDELTQDLTIDVGETTSLGDLSMSPETTSDDGGSTLLIVAVILIIVIAGAVGFLVIRKKKQA